jgi:hypothetical protein
MAPGTIFTTLHFLLNLQIGPISNIKLGCKGLTRDKHSSLLDPFVSYKKLFCEYDTLPANFRNGSGRETVTTTLAYYIVFFIIAITRFITLA